MLQHFYWIETNMQCNATFIFEVSSSLGEGGGEVELTTKINL